jgi:FKBP-type peptidyl-prolyl cis-trans isomerase (trigger factor)
MNEKITHTLAREEDGGVQIVFTIPVSLVKSAKTKALTALGAGTEIPGFRKGKAPLDQVEAKISPQTVIEKTLQQLLPQALADAIKEANLKLAIYPRFEAIKIKDDEPWQIKAVSCEIPEITLGDYKKAVGGALRAKAIWTPGKGDKTPKEPTKEEKEQAAIAAILENVKIVIPKMLATEEVDSRLSALLERLEKLGLNLDGYLASIGKTPESLRAEYETQAKNAIALELIL